jgi:hypothetical protein
MRNGMSKKDCTKNNNKMKPKKFEVYQEIADNLNNAGVKPFSAREFKAHNIKSVLYGAIGGPKVWDEIIKVFTFYNLDYERYLARQIKTKS